MKTFSAHLDDAVCGLAWNADDSLLIAGSASGAVTLFRFTSDGATQTWLAHPMGLLALAVAGDHLATAGQDGTVKIWSLATGELRHTLAAGKGWVEHLAFSPDGLLLATTCGKGLKIWDLRDKGGALLHEYAAHDSTLTGLSWRPDSRGVAVSFYGHVRLYRFPDLEPYEDLTWKGSFISLAWSPNARYISAGTQEASVNFWRLPYRQGDELDMTGYATKVRELAWDPESRYLATGGGEKITIWDVSGKGPSGTRPAELCTHLGRVSALAWQAAGPLLASGDADGLALIWHPAKTKREITGEKLDGSITKLQWANRSAWVAAGDVTGEISVLKIS